MFLMKFVEELLGTTSVKMFLTVQVKKFNISLRNGCDNLEEVERGWFFSK